uniref:Uncharacterized protein n=1 Tax=Bathycoccus sp. RCC716 virus 2 TaxID=2530039 RepID=A0A7S6SWC0_9PHYC|nr:hypothetical protein [Bathycoccus sp. RCC716 virus 2]
MIRLFSKRISSALNIFPLPPPSSIPLYHKPKDNRIDVYPRSNDEEMTRTHGSENGYSILIDVCHDKHTIDIDHDMSSYEEFNDLPRIVKALGCLYPNYTLKK